MPGALLILLPHGFHKILGLVMGHQVDGGTAETATGQARAETPGMGPGELHQQIQLWNTVLEKIPRALMALEHVLAELAVIIIPQSLRAEDDPLDFADHMIGAFVLARREF